MSEDDSSPNEETLAKAWVATLEAELARVRVDFRAAAPDLHEVDPPERRDDDPTGEFTESFTIDVSGIVETLRRLPDGAGTAAFVAAYNDKHSDWRGGPSSER